MALLSGPPGLGKTTVAHVIAKHAGYNVVEMNARLDRNGTSNSRDSWTGSPLWTQWHRLCFCSDDRSAEVFQKRIDTATQMKSVLGSDERPNCLIIDEIDGAPAVRFRHLEPEPPPPHPQPSRSTRASVVSVFIHHLWCSAGCHQHPVSNAEQKRRARQGSWCRDFKEEKEEGDHPAATDHLHL